MKCEDCEYSHNGSSAVFTDKLYCHRFPPVLMTWPGKEPMTMTYTIDYIPIDTINNMTPCGEFKEKKNVGN